MTVYVCDFMISPLFFGIFFCLFYFPPLSAAVRSDPLYNLHQQTDSPQLDEAYATAREHARSQTRQQFPSNKHFSRCAPQMHVVKLNWPLPAFPCFCTHPTTLKHVKLPYFSLLHGCYFFSAH